MTQAKRPQAFPGLARMLRPFGAAPNGRALHDFPDSWSIRKKYLDELYINWFERLQSKRPPRGRNSLPLIQLKL